MSCNPEGCVSKAGAKEERRIVKFVTFFKESLKKVFCSRYCVLNALTHVKVNIGVKRHHRRLKSNLMRN